MTTYYVVCECSNGHVTKTEIGRPEFDGQYLTGGFCGSDRDFCQVCDDPTMRALGYTPPRGEGPSHGLAPYPPEQP